MKRFTRTLSLFLVIVMSMGIFGIQLTVQAASASISYQFSGANANDAGYAQGTISFTADASGTYRLYWADDTKELEGYSRIAKFTMSSGQTQSVTLGYHTAIPAKATRIIALLDGTSASEAKAVYAIPSQKQLSAASGKLLYKFSAYSDIHIDKGSGWYVDAETHFKEGLQYATDKGSDYLIVSGDCVTNDSGPDKEWKVYETILKESNFVNPVWESDGNHDMRQDVDSGLKSFIRGSGIDSTKEGFDAGKPYYYKVEENTGDLFLFMALEMDKSPGQADVLSDEQLAWANQLVKEYTEKGVNVFLVEHAPIKGFGAGDRMDNPYYGGLMNRNKESTKKFRAMLEQYKNIIWVSGHTHEDFEMDYNYSDENGTAAHMLHIPSLAGSTMPNSTDDGLERNNGKGFHSQGYFTEVYENKVVFYGVNIADGTIYPKYSYIMDSLREQSKALYPTRQDQEETGPDVSISGKISEISGVLSSYYKYASYDQFQTLKKLYFTYKNQSTAKQSVLDELNQAIADLKEIAEYTGAEKVYPIGHEYYFENNLSWSKVYAYAWTGSQKNAEWPGVQISKAGTSNGHDVYRVTFSEDGQFANLIFSDGSNQTVDIDLSHYQYNAFRTNGSSSGKYKVSNFGYQQQEISGSDYALLYYISGVHDWSGTDTLLTKKTDGLYEYVFTASDSYNISFSLYDKTNKKYHCPPESVSMEYAEGLVNPVSLSSMSSRGRSITVKTLAKGDQLTLTYDPSTDTLTVRTKEIPVEDPVNTSTLSSDTVILGSKIVVNASAEGGTAPYTYTVKYKKASSTAWTVKQDQKSNDTVFVLPGSATDYEIQVIVTDSNGRTAEKLLTCHVTPALTNQSTVSAQQIGIGKKVTVNAKAAGGAGDYQYAVYYRRSGASSWTTVQTYSENQTVAIKPGSVQDYDILVKVKDRNGSVAKKTFTVKVAPKLSMNATLSSSSIRVGEEVTIQAQGIDGGGTYRYAVYYKKSSSSKWYERQAYKANRTVTLKLGSATPYEICVKVQDSDGTVVKQYFTVAVQK